MSTTTAPIPGNPDFHYATLVKEHRNDIIFTFMAVSLVGVGILLGVKPSLFHISGNAGIAAAVALNTVGLGFGTGAIIENVNRTNKKRKRVDPDITSSIPPPQTIQPSVIDPRSEFITNIRAEMLNETRNSKKPPAEVYANCKQIAFSQEDSRNILIAGKILTETFPVFAAQEPKFIVTCSDGSIELPFYLKEVLSSASETIAHLNRDGDLDNELFLGNASTQILLKIIESLYGPEIDLSSFARQEVNFVDMLMICNYLDLKRFDSIVVNKLDTLAPQKKEDIQVVLNIRSDAKKKHATVFRRIEGVIRYFLNDALKVAEDKEWLKQKLSNINAQL